MQNPLLQDWKTPFKIPPFEEIKAEHYSPAFEEALQVGLSEVEAIANNEENPDFTNTIDALELAGELFFK